MAREFYRIWLGRGVRVAPVVGLVAACWYSWTVLDRYQKDDESWRQLELTYRCAAGLSDDERKARMGLGGNINVKDICLTGDDFWVSQAELAKLQAGKMEFRSSWSPYDAKGALLVGLLWAVLTVLATLGILGVTYVCRWVWGGPATGNR